jgi:hypothetical protein
MAAKKKKKKATTPKATARPDSPETTPEAPQPPEVAADPPRQPKPPAKPKPPEPPKSETATECDGYSVGQTIRLPYSGDEVTLSGFYQESSSGEWMATFEGGAVRVKAIAAPSSIVQAYGES